MTDNDKPESFRIDPEDSRTNSAGESTSANRAFAELLGTPYVDPQDIKPSPSTKRDGKYIDSGSGRSARKKRSNSGRSSSSRGSSSRGGSSGSSKSRSGGSKRRSASKRKARLRRNWIIAGSVTALVLLAGAASVSVVLRTLEVRTDLEAAIPLMGTVQDQIKALDNAGAQETAAKLSAATGEARSKVGGVDWWFVEQVPVLGNNFTAIRTATEVADEVAKDVITPVSALSLASLKPANGQIDLAAVTDAGDVLEKASAVLTEGDERVQALSRAGLIPQVTTALTKIEDPLKQASTQVSAAAPIVGLLPGMLGADGPRNYVVMFMNSAESRALGGAAGATSLLRVDEGHIEIIQTASNRDFGQYGNGAVPMPEDARAVFDDGGGIATAGSSYLNLTTRPDFSFAAQSAAVMWADSFGVSVDTVIGIDPVALSYILSGMPATVLPDGGQLDGSNVVSQMLHQVYQDYPGLNNEANLAQDAFFSTVVSATFGNLLNGAVDIPSILDAAAKSGKERRLLIWSSSEAEQQILESADLTGALPTSSDETSEFGLYLTDAVGSKLEYYLQQSTVVSTACPADGPRTVTITTTLHNSIDTVDYSTEGFEYIVGEYNRENLRPGVMKLRTYLYAPAGSVTTSASVDGAPVQVAVGKDSGLTVGSVVVEIAPGASVTLSYTAELPSGRNAPASLLTTPIVQPSAVEYTRETC